MILYLPRPGGQTLFERVDTDYADLDEALAQALSLEKTIEDDFRVVIDLSRQAIKAIRAEMERKNDR